MKIAMLVIHTLPPRPFSVRFQRSGLRHPRLCQTAQARFRAIATLTKMEAITNKECLVLPTQPRHDDIIIRRRFGEHASTHTVKQIYAVTYPGHTDQGAEHENYGEAEEVALGLAQERRGSVWFEENPHSGRRTLVKSFTDSE
jgi:hypothetical protein